jgi:molecular chaperone DnaK (HSP70)
MKLGIDFGTNRIVVAAADRGNYPLVSFETPDGATADWFPSLIALRGAERRYGWQAWFSQAGSSQAGSNQDDIAETGSWTVIRSIKRLLEDAGPRTLLDLGGEQYSVTELLNGLAAALLAALRESFNLTIGPDDALQAVIGVPAHANSNQRFLTVDAFRRAGFEILGVLNEPSAASIEFGHRQRQSKSAPETILVYDLGGGTFDASLVTLDNKVHHVVASAGIPSIGGDDFDYILAEMALESAGLSIHERDRMPAAAWFRLLEECRLKKESLNPNSRRLTIDLEQIDPGRPSVQLAVADFYELARPLVEETLGASEDLLAKHPGEFEALYVTGGGSELPLVARVLRERFGRRVRRSAYTRSATAIGLAIQAAEPETYRLSDCLARFFGVWREADGGSRITFDPLFEKGLALPPSGAAPLVIRRAYSPVHNVGHFRFLECSHLAADGSPSGEIAIWDEVRFAFDPALQNSNGLTSEHVRHSSGAYGQRIEEVYECDSDGSISVTIANLSNGDSRAYRLGRWSEERKTLKSGGRRKRAAAAP